MVERLTRVKRDCTLHTCCTSQRGQNAVCIQLTGFGPPYVGQGGFCLVYCEGYRLVLQSQIVGPCGGVAVRQVNLPIYYLFINVGGVVGQVGIGVD